MHRFLCDTLCSGLVYLSESESHHAIKVLRLRVGECCELMDGKGSKASAVFHGVEGKLACFDAKEPLFFPRPPGLVLAVATTHQADRWEWMAEKLTELGVSILIPMTTDHTERNRIRMDRIEKIMLAAMKQSGQPYLPQLEGIQGFQEVISSFDHHRRWIAWADHQNTKGFDAYQEASTGNWVMMIGPEGDFSSRERQAAVAAGWEPVHFGNAVYRVETAAIWVAVARQVGLAGG